MPEGRRPIRVLVVDDSAVMRKLLPTVLTRDPEIEVVATATDGIAGLRKLARFRPDVVTLDLEMPGMTGLEVLREMVMQSTTPVLVVSAHTQANAAQTVAALSMGAVDCVAKPKDLLSGGLERMAGELLSKVRAVAGRRWKRPANGAVPRPLLNRPPLRSHSRARRVVAIAASTGGPAALAYVLPRLPATLEAAVLVVQHMPEGFTAMLAQRLDNASPMRVSEAIDGEPLLHGRALVARGGFQLRVRSGIDGPVALVDPGPNVSGHCPSADVLFRSVAAEFAGHAVGVILTGMGDDGASGLELMHRSSCVTLAQDEASCVVYGMPKAAVGRGAVGQVVPLERIPEVIINEVERLTGHASPASLQAGGR